MFQALVLVVGGYPGAAHTGATEGGLDQRALGVGADRYSDVGGRDGALTAALAAHADAPAKSTCDHGRDGLGDGSVGRVEGLPGQFEERLKGLETRLASHSIRASGCLGTQSGGPLVGPNVGPAGRGHNYTVPVH